jgi:Domain of unknown function (DUF3806)
MDQKIGLLSAEHSTRLERQRSWVRDHYDPETRHRYDTLEGKLRLLETILEEKWIQPNETWKLQSLGIALGDALVQQTGLVWATVADDLGCDPALRDPGTGTAIFPLTMISKRAERGEAVDIRKLFAGICSKITQLRNEPPHKPIH